MADKTLIEWADATWNPITGCTPISDGCKNCYAKRLIRRFPALHGYRETGPVVNGYIEIEPIPFGEIRFHPERLDQPLKWKKPRRIFVCSMSDLFHEDVKLEWFQKVYTVIMESERLNPGHTFLMLTKHPKRMSDLIRPKVPLKNLWLGVTVESDKYLHRIDTLLQIPAAVRFVSVEPMLGPIMFSDPDSPCGENYPGLDWVILGAESGPGRRPCKIEWMGDVVRQCDDAGMPVFVKQIHNAAGRVVKDINLFPEQLQRREFPK